MNRKQTLDAIKALDGMTATCADGEFRVTFSVIAIRTALIDARKPTSFAYVQERAEQVACYTDCPIDALGTAKAMQAEGFKA